MRRMEDILFEGVVYSVQSPERKKKGGKNKEWSGEKDRHVKDGQASSAFDRGGNKGAKPLVKKVEKKNDGPEDKVASTDSLGSSDRKEGKARKQGSVSDLTSSNVVRSSSGSNPVHRSSPDSRSSAGNKSNPGYRPSSDSRSSPVYRPSPDARSSPNSRSSTNYRASPDSRSSAGNKLNSGYRSSPDSRSSPGYRSSSDSRSSPGYRSSSDYRSSADSSLGARSSPSFRKNGIVQPKRIVSQDEASALQNQLFGWRSFLISQLVLEPGEDRVQFVNVTDLKVNMLLREAERKNLYYCVGGEGTVLVQRKPFFRSLPGSDPNDNEIVRLIQKCGSCVTEAGSVQYLDQTLLSSPLLVRLRIGRVKFVQLAGEIEDAANTKVIDASSSRDAKQGLVVPPTFFQFCQRKYFLFLKLWRRSR